MEIEEVIKYLDKIKIKIPFENDTSLVNNLVGNYIGYFYLFFGKTNDKNDTSTYSRCIYSL